MHRKVYENARVCEVITLEVRTPSGRDNSGPHTAIDCFEVKTGVRRAVPYTFRSMTRWLTYLFLIVIIVIVLVRLGIVGLLGRNSSILVVLVLIEIIIGALDLGCSDKNTATRQLHRSGGPNLTIPARFSSQ